MMIADSIARAGRSLRSAKGRTTLTALAIAVGAFTLTAALAAGTGARQYADKLISSNVDPQSVFVVKDKKMTDGGGGDSFGGLQEYKESNVQYGGTTFEALNESDLQKLRQIDGVERVLPTYLIKAQYVTFEGNDQKYVSDITTYDATVRAEVAAGSLPALGTQIDKESVVIPASYAEKLGKKPEEMIGKKIILHLVKATATPSQGELQQAFMTGGVAAVEALTTVESRDVTLTVAAVSAKSSTSFSASAALFIADSQADELSNYLTEGTAEYKTYISATATAKKDVDPAEVKKKIEQNGLYAMTAKDLQGLIFRIVDLLQGIVLGFGVLALIASVFGIINTQYISVLERTREIGLMKALGMRGRHVSRLFQYEAAWIGLLGGVIGAALAWGIGIALNPWISEKMGIGSNRILVFELWPIVGLIIALMLIAMIAGWFPARKAAKLDPIEALRTE